MTLGRLVVLMSLVVTTTVLGTFPRSQPRLAEVHMKATLGLITMTARPRARPQWTLPFAVAERTNHTTETLWRRLSTTTVGPRRLALLGMGTADRVPRDRDVPQEDVGRKWTSPLAPSPSLRAHSNAGRGTPRKGLPNCVAESWIGRRGAVMPLGHTTVTRWLDYTTTMRLTPRGLPPRRRGSAPLAVTRACSTPLSALVEEVT